MRYRLSGLVLALSLLFIAIVSAAEPAFAQKDAAPQQDILTSTPLADGSIVHIVQQDETLATIAQAYGVSMDAIRGMNGMAATSNLIFPGQKLIIRLPQPPTATPTLTATVPRPTRTPTVATPTRTPRPTRTPTITPTPTATPNPAVAAVSGFVDGNRQVLLAGMVALCAIGLGWTLWSGFRRGPRID